MKTKEEILKSSTSGFELFPMTPSDEKKMLMDMIYYAMEEYAEQQVENSKLPRKQSVIITYRDNEK